MRSRLHDSSRHDLRRLAYLKCQAVLLELHLLDLREPVLREQSRLVVLLQHLALLAHVQWRSQRSQRRVVVVPPAPPALHLVLARVVVQQSRAVLVPLLDEPVQLVLLVPLILAVHQLVDVHCQHRPHVHHQPRQVLVRELQLRDRVSWPHIRSPQLQPITYLLLLCLCQRYFNVKQGIIVKGPLGSVIFSFELFDSTTPPFGVEYLRLLVLPQLVCRKFCESIGEGQQF